MRALQVDGDPRALRRWQTVERTQAGLGDARRMSSRDIRRDDGPALRFGHLDERAVIGRVARPGPRRLQELLFGDRAGQIRVETRLRVALEHLERQRDRHTAATESLQDRGFEAVGVRIVVLLADEHDIGLRDIGEHALQIGKGQAARVVDALGNVDRRGGSGHLSGLRQEDHDSEGH